jgi:hypothetical protein
LLNCSFFFTLFGFGGTVTLLQLFDETVGGLQIEACGVGFALLFLITRSERPKTIRSIEIKLFELTFP